MQRGQLLTRSKSRQKGFTIVELLIVVIVIAILATITIVTFTGIQNRARDTRIVSAAVTYVKAIKSYQTTYSNALPMTSTPSSILCFDGTECWGGTDVANSQAMRTELRKVISTLPEYPPEYAMLTTNLNTTNQQGNTHTGWYLLFQIHGSNATCPTVAGLTFLNSNVASNGNRTCRVSLDIPA